MKAAILSMTSGEGHNSIARVICKKLQDLGVESEIFDLFKSDGFEYKFNNWGFLFACSHFPRTYDFFWKKLKFRKSERRYHGTAQHEVEKVADTISRQIDSGNFDFFICVHPYTAVLCDLWRRQGKYKDKKVFALLTDLLPHPLWESAIECDYVLTPTEHSFRQLEQKGFSPKQTTVSGFPVGEKFLQRQNKQEVRSLLNLQDKFTVLLVGGGYGLGKNWKVAKLLQKNDVQVLCVNGRNKKAFEKTKKVAKNNVNVKNFGFVDNLDRLMDASDVIVTKAGCATLFEAMSKRLPIVVREKQIINERENAEILQNAGAAICLKKLKQLPVVIEHLQNDPDKIASMQEAEQNVCQNICVDDVCKKILNML